MSRIYLCLGAVFGFLGVAFGAFGAHALEGRVADPDLLDTWATGARYHLVHALALCAVAAHPSKPALAGWLFAAGIVLFSGSLYLLAITGVGTLGAVTPFGGMALIAGWVLLALAAVRG